MPSSDPLRPSEGLIRIRPARRDDAVPLAGVAVRIWQTVYDGVLPREALQALRPQRWVTRFSTPAGDRSCVFVAEHRQAGIIGYGVCGPVAARRKTGARGEVFELYVAPAFHGQGAGRGLMAAMAGFLQLRDLEPVDVWVLEDNPRAIAFYEHLGGRRRARGSTEFGGVRFPIIGYRLGDLDRVMGLSWIDAGGRVPQAPD